MAKDYYERCRWAVEIIDPQPGDNILEIGCGSGTTAVLLSSFSNKLSITAIDSSAKMMAECSKLPSTENLLFIHTQLNKAKLMPSSFNKIFVFNMNVFWMDPREELSLISKFLTENGKFFLFHQPPPEHDPSEFAAAFNNNLKRNGFLVIEEIYKELRPVNAICLISRPDQKQFNKKTGER